MKKEIQIPDGFEAKIEGNMVIFVPKDSEDERIRTRLIALVEAFGQGKYKNEMLTYLERKEQKPAEWSEEDEKMFQRIICYTESEYQDWCNDKYGHSEIVSDGKQSCLERLDWLENQLKFLRPQHRWKPSEEQMQGLRRGIVKADEGSDAKNAMVSLYNDLKKL